jgi:hypothetical protein
MSCDRHTDAIVDHACGAEIAAEAAVHLDGCAACRRLFDEQHRLVRDLDQQMALALEIEPSPRFVPGVLARVERPAFGFRDARWWGGAAAAAAVLMIVTFGSLPSSERRSEDQRAAAAPPQVSSLAVADRPPSPVTTVPSPEATSQPIDSRRRVDRPRSVVGRPGGIEADVVVSAEGSRALARYLALVRRGELDASTLTSPGEAGLAAPSELVIVPLTVDTLAMTDVKAGIGPVSRGESGIR